MLSFKTCLVTGGSGYFGSILVSQLVKNGWKVKVLDINVTDAPIPGVEYIEGDIRDLNKCIQATTGVDVVFHNVAQVPLAKNRKLFKDVNIEGTHTLCEACRISGIGNFVYTSSSAVYGLPSRLPVRLSDEKRPIEEYGKAKLTGELIVNNLQDFGVRVNIIRPRTILGSGRLGIFSLLFQWIDSGYLIFTLGSAEGKYQFIHAIDLAEGIMRSLDVPGSREYNLGATRFDSLKVDLESLCKYAKSNSRIVALPDKPIRSILTLLSSIKILPFASYQLQLYSRAMFFDSHSSWQELRYEPRFSNSEAMIDSYEWYRKNKSNPERSGQSRHQAKIKGKSISLVNLLLKVVTWIDNRLFNMNIAER